MEQKQIYIVTVKNVEKKQVNNKEENKMKMTNKELINRWINNLEHNGSNHTGSLRIEEGRLYTYKVLLAHFENGSLVLNTKRYSNTSSRHRNLTRQYAEAKGINIVERG